MLLNILSKVLKIVVVVEKLSYFIKKYGLLSNSYFKDYKSVLIDHTV